MFALIIIFAPLVALIAWGVVYDIRRRRRRLPDTGHDIRSAVARARGNADGRGSVQPGDGISTGECEVGASESESNDGAAAGVKPLTAPPTFVLSYVDKFGDKDDLTFAFRATAGLTPHYIGTGRRARSSLSRYQPVPLAKGERVRVRRPPWRPG